MQCEFPDLAEVLYHHDLMVWIEVCWASHQVCRTTLYTRESRVYTMYRQRDLRRFSMYIGKVEYTKIVFMIAMYIYVHI
jgi:hypothetical protein